MAAAQVRQRRCQPSPRLRLSGGEGAAAAAAAAEWLAVGSPSWASAATRMPLQSSAALGACLCRLARRPAPPASSPGTGRRAGWQLASRPAVAAASGRREPHVRRRGVRRWPLRCRILAPACASATAVASCTPAGGTRCAAWTLRALAAGSKRRVPGRAASSPRDPSWSPRRNPATRPGVAWHPPRSPEPRDPSGSGTRLEPSRKVKVKQINV